MVTEAPMTTDRSTQAALLALLDTMIADSHMFAPQVVASAAERARDMIVALDSSLTASGEALKRIMREADCDDDDAKDALDYIYQIAERAVAAMEKANG